MTEKMMTFSPTGESHSSYFDARARRETVAAERAELALARERGELIPAGELGPALDRYVDDVLGVIEGIPEKYAPLLQEAPDLEAKHQVLRAAVREIREILANHKWCVEADREENHDG